MSEPEVVMVWRCPLAQAAATAAAAGQPYISGAVFSDRPDSVRGLLIQASDEVTSPVLRAKLLRAAGVVEGFPDGLGYQPE
jgi:hypothetical protein